MPRSTVLVLQPNRGETFYFATSTLNSITEVTDKRVVRENLGTFEELRHSLLKDEEAGEWKWYYGKAGRVELRTAPLKGVLNRSGFAAERGAVGSDVAVRRSGSGLMVSGPIV